MAATDTFAVRRRSSNPPNMALPTRTKAHVCGAIIASIILSAIGLSETLAHKVSSPVSLRLWFPAAAIVKRFGGGDISALVAALLQFACLAALYIGVLRWRSPFVATLVICSAYLTLMLLAAR